MAELYKVDDQFDHSLFKGSSCAFGVFDGVHKGHRYLLECAQKTAHEFGGKSIALTFDIDPDEIFHPERLRKLLSNERRIEFLLQSGVDAVVVLPFTREFAALSPEEFLKETFNGFAPSNLHIGLDFHFGAKAAGSVADLAEWGARVGTHIDAHNLRSADGAPITATRIRLLLGEHNLDEAEKLLGRRFSMVEKVRPGRGEGADMGFSTANLYIEPNRRVLLKGYMLPMLSSRASATVLPFRWEYLRCLPIRPMRAARSIFWTLIRIFMANISKLNSLSICVP